MLIKLSLENNFRPPICVIKFTTTKGVKEVCLNTLINQVSKTLNLIYHGAVRGSGQGLFP